MFVEYCLCIEKRNLANFELFSLEIKFFANLRNNCWGVEQTSRWKLRTEIVSQYSVDHEFHRWNFNFCKAIFASNSHNFHQVGSDKSSFWKDPESKRMTLIRNPDKWNVQKKQLNYLIIFHRNYGKNQCFCTQNSCCKHNSFIE